MAPRNARRDERLALSVKRMPRTLLLFFAHFVLTDLDNPFEGSWNLSAEPFAELVSKSSKQIDENP